MELSAHELSAKGVEHGWPLMYPQIFTSKSAGVTIVLCYHTGIL